MKKAAQSKRTSNPKKKPALTRSQPAPDIVSDVGETFDLNVSETSSQEAAPSKQSVDALPPSEPSTSLAPLLPSVPTGQSNRAHDVDYFFHRESEEKTICKSCQ
jgi:hypothetical protein